jgi:hypothetical protein
LLSCAALKRSSTGHEIEDEHDDGEYKEDVYPSAKRVTADESYDPEDEEDNCDCPKHFFFLLDDYRLYLPRFAVMVSLLALTSGKVRGRSGRLPERE